MEAFDLGSDRLREMNPRLIYVSVSGFGRTGPYRRRPAYDIIVQALGGLMSITGNEDGPPVRVGTSISDLLGGLYSALAVLAALVRRGRTERGADVDLAMLDCTVAILENAISRFAVTGEVPRPIGTRHPSIAPFQAFRAADGALVIGVANDSLWRKLCAVLELPHLVADPLLLTNPLRTTNYRHLEAAIHDALAKRTVHDWLSRLEAAGIPAAPINDVEQVLADPQLAARSMWHTLVDADGHGLVTPGSPVMLDGAKPRLSKKWPRLGEHQVMASGEWELESGG